jgi:hypothetical protein
MTYLRGLENWRRNIVMTCNWAERFNFLYIKSAIFWDITPCSLLKVYRRFGETYRWARYQRDSRWQAEVSCSAYSTLKMEAVCFSETSVAFHLTTRCYIPEYRTLHKHHCENLNFYIVMNSLLWHVPQLLPASALHGSGESSVRASNIVTSPFMLFLVFLYLVFKPDDIYEFEVEYRTISSSANVFWM